MTDEKRRRSKGDGTLAERRPGVWRLRVFIGTDPVTKKPRQAERTVRGNRTKALAELRRFAVEVGEDPRTAATRGTLGFLLDEWLKFLPQTGLREVTVETYEINIRRHIRPALGAIQLSKLTAHDLDSYYGAKGAALSSGSVRLHHAILSAALTQALKWGWVPTNVAKAASPPKLIRAEKQPPSADGVRALIEAASDDIDLATAVALAALTGARRAELCGLRWSDVDWGSETILIERGHVRVGKGAERHAVVGPTKSDKPRRVALGTEGIKILTIWKAEQEARAKAVEREPDWGGWLLASDFGHTAVDPWSLSKRFEALGKRAGVPVTPHLLRHWAATQMVAAGVDVRTAAGRLGHTPEVLLRVYSHLLPSRDGAAADILSTALDSGRAGLPPAGGG